MQIVRSGVVYRNMKSSAFLKDYYRSRVLNMIEGNEVYGSSPPDIFIGRAGYPNVYIGPLVPPTIGDTSIMGIPEKWVGKSIAEIVEFRSMLVRGMHRTNVSNADNGRVEEMIKELAISDKYELVRQEFSKRPDMRIRFDENTQPFGPSAILKRMELEGGKVNRTLEKAYSDTDMTASNAMVELYSKGIEVSRIQKMISAGTIGVGKNRKLVPTRWSITAVDDTLGKNNLKSVKENEELEEVLVYQNDALDNRWLIMMFPGSWEYELVEAWYPNTTWNRESSNIQIFSSYEPYKGRSKYAEIGGCYYAARLASSELLLKMDRQAKVAILREAHSGYIMPVGVWNVREHVRDALRKEPLRFENTRSAIEFIAKRMDIPIKTWMENSAVLRQVTRQKRLV
jgi:hypothetical protein